MAGIVFHGLPYKLSEASGRLKKVSRTLFGPRKCARGLFKPPGLLRKFICHSMKNKPGRFFVLLFLQRILA